MNSITNDRSILEQHLFTTNNPQIQDLIIRKGLEYITINITTKNDIKIKIFFFIIIFIFFFL